ncbi:hypothetical protein GF326_11740 [Candidatus Bathyarchaeota archaeon]|nr:hypothetical protein [Candidatus Bathyarchaeota archaeon]
MQISKPQLISEFLGSMFLALAAISPMILFPYILKSSIGLAVLADAISVAFILGVLIEIFAPISGAHFNPVVSVLMAYLDRISYRNAVKYTLVQILGGFTGLLISHLMFFHNIPKILQVSEINRNGGSYIGEVFGTMILLLAILLLIENRHPRIGWNIGLLVGGQLLATSSTMFANPMITIVRIFTYSAAGIHPIDSLIFIIMQLTGLGLTIIIWDQFEVEKA